MIRLRRKSDSGQSGCPDTRGIIFLPALTLPRRPGIVECLHPGRPAPARLNTEPSAPNGLPRPPRLHHKVLMIRPSAHFSHPSPQLHLCLSRQPLAPVQQIQHTVSDFPGPALADKLNSLSPNEPTENGDTSPSHTDPANSDRVPSFPELPPQRPAKTIQESIARDPFGCGEEIGQRF